MPKEDKGSAKPKLIPSPTSPRLPTSHPKTFLDASKKVIKPKEDLGTKQYKLQRGLTHATIATTVFLAVTMTAAIAAAIFAYNNYQALLSEYEAQNRPNLIIQGIEFTGISENNTYLLIHMTNFGDRPARNIGIESINLCTISPERCELIKWAAEENQDNTIVYPGRLRTTRIAITEEGYQKILATDILALGLQYHYGGKRFMYDANLRRVNNTWEVETEQEY
jgi:hypothetical protein